MSRAAPIAEMKKKPITPLADFMLAVALRNRLELRRDPPLPDAYHLEIAAEYDQGHGGVPAVWHAAFKLARKGLITLVESARPRWAGVRLSENGIAAAQRLPMQLHLPPRTRGPETAIVGYKAKGVVSKARRRR